MTRGEGDLVLVPLAAAPTGFGIVQRGDTLQITFNCCSTPEIQRHSVNGIVICGQCARHLFMPIDAISYASMAWVTEEKSTIAVWVSGWTGLKNVSVEVKWPSF